MSTTMDLAAHLSAIIALQQQVIAVTPHGEVALTELLVKETPDITNADGAIVQFLHGEDLVFRAVSGSLQRFVGIHIPTEQSLSGLCIRTREVLRSDHSLLDPRVDSEAAHEMGIGSMVVAPLTDHEMPVGVLMVYSARTEAFGDLDVYSLQLIAGMTSTALMLARELEERRTSEERYRLLFEQNVSGVFRSSIDGRILDCNAALVHVFGYNSREELLQLRSTDLYEDHSIRERLIEQLAQQRSMTNVSVPFKRKDGSTFKGLMNIAIIRAAGNETQLLGTVVEDNR